jgi:putative oxidoreductase
MQSAGLLLLRVGVGFAMVRGHGWGKVMDWSSLFDRFPDPIGLGSGVTLGLVIFAEVVCAVLIMTGLFTRLATIPLIIDMAVAFFIVHNGEAWVQREPSLLFLIPFVTLLITGPGWYSLDNIRKRFRKSRKAKALSSPMESANVAAPSFADPMMKPEGSGKQSGPTG